MITKIVIIRKSKLQYYIYLNKYKFFSYKLNINKLNIIYNSIFLIMTLTSVIYFELNYILFSMGCLSDVLISFNEF